MQRITSDTKSEPTLVDCSQLQAGTMLQQHALEQTPIDKNGNLVFVKVELVQTISNESFEIVECSSEKQSPAPYTGILQKT